MSCDIIYVLVSHFVVCIMEKYVVQIRTIGDYLHITLMQHFHPSCISELEIGYELRMGWFNNINLTSKLVSRIGTTCIW